MNPYIPLEYGKYYHIYNRGINGEVLFKNNDNYHLFLLLYDKYIEPVADTFAWCLLGNHFHLLVRVKEENEIDFLEKEVLNGIRSLSVKKHPPTALNDNKKVRINWKPKPSNQFSHLFNAYAKSFNKAFFRHGGLFETPFRRIQVGSENYFQKLIFYIHNNPVHHGFVKNMVEYPWSSYLTMASDLKTSAKRGQVLEWFGGQENLIEFHRKKQDDCIHNPVWIEFD